MTDQSWLAQKPRNAFHSLLLIGSMVAVLSALGWIVAGSSGLLLSLIVGGFFFLLSARVPARWLIRFYGARPVSRFEAPFLFEVVRRLARRAGLGTLPQLFYLSTRRANAFAIGSPNDSVIGVSEGLLQSLSPREIENVLAHEIAHVRNNDLRLMGLAALVSRATFWLSWVGQLLILLNLPLILMGQWTIPWTAALTLVFAPTASTLLQLALSRTREFDADLGAVTLTGHPRGLASALAKLERLQRGLLNLNRLFLRGRGLRKPTLLRSHPQTEERIKRLLDLETGYALAA